MISIVRRERLRGLGPGAKVGLSWRGGTIHTRSRSRSIELAGLLPLLRTPGARFVSVQYGDCHEELARLQADHDIAVEHWPDAVTITLITLVLCLIATLYPSWKAASLDPVEAIRND